MTLLEKYLMMLDRNFNDVLSELGCYAESEARQLYLKMRLKTTQEFFEETKIRIEHMKERDYTRGVKTKL